MPPHDPHHPPHDPHDRGPRGPHPQGPHHHRHHLHHYLEADLGVLDELSRRKREATTATLIKLAEDCEMAEVVQYLRRVLDEYGDIRAVKALRLADDHFAAKAEQRIDRLMESGAEMGLVFPLPPHVHEPFIARGNISVYVPSGHHVPHHLRRSGVPLIEGTRACRQDLLNSAVAALIFEMHRVDGRRLVDPEVADLLSAVTSARQIQLWAQLRPHEHPDDIEFDAVGDVEFI